MAAPWVGVVVVVGAVLLGVFGLLVGALLFRVACRMCSVSAPGLGAALIIVLVTTFLNGVIILSIGMLSQLATAAVGGGGPATAPVRVVVLLITVLVSMLVSARFYSATLDGVSPGTGMLIWLTQQLLNSAVAVGAAALVFLLALPFGGLGSIHLPPA